MQQKNIDFLEVDDFQAIPGHGIEATISGKNILVGNRKLMKDHKLILQIMKKN